MRYNLIRKQYPWFHDCMEHIAHRIHAGENPERVVNDQRWRVEALARPAHTGPMLEKMERLAVVVAEIHKRYNADTYRQPAQCPVCHSLDTGSGFCRWCHQEVRIEEGK